ncbi:unnamed protein product [Staurois parvus]|uniref:Uncharacterized protein n=1 Tax=Staurois parvus TaxID=386267 RepID=A0ABN9CM21_9NEOB|nr:unnamed protein product [Staurois parvus]
MSGGSARRRRQNHFRVCPSLLPGKKTRKRPVPKSPACSHWWIGPRAEALKVLDLALDCGRL